MAGAFVPRTVSTVNAGEGDPIRCSGVTSAHSRESECRGREGRRIGKEACMRRILMLSLLAAAACGGPSRGELEVDWTFQSVSCAEAAVAFIRVDIANEVLSPNQFTCQEAGLGANLGVYYAGDYEITITGMDANQVI